MMMHAQSQGIRAMQPAADMRVCPGHAKSKKEIVGVVHIGETTLLKRVNEFTTTEAGGLTVDEFESHTEAAEAALVCPLRCHIANERFHGLRAWADPRHGKKVQDLLRLAIGGGDDQTYLHQPLLESLSPALRACTASDQVSWLYHREAM